MKRIVGYISVVASLLLGLLVALVPSFINVNGTGDYESMRTYVYKISEKTFDISNGGTTDDGNISDQDKQNRLDDAVNEFKVRLDNADISDYRLETSGLDTIKVTFKTESALYDDISSYLNFSWSFMASTYSGDPTAGQTPSEIASLSGDANFFESGSARIEYRDNYPYVVVSLSDPEQFKTIVTAASEAEADSEDSSDNSTEEGEEETTANENLIFILNNWVDGLTIDTLIENKGNEFLSAKQIKEHILFTFDATNPSSFYWDYDANLSEEDQTNAVYNEIYFGGYNLSSTEDNAFYGATESDRVLAYKKANIWMHKFNSSSYDFNVTLLNVNGDNAYTTTVKPFTDFLVYMNSINWSNGLFIATLIAAIVVSLFLVLNYGINGISAILNGVAMFISSIGLFNTFGSEFNIGTIIGLISLVMLSIFSSGIYFKKIKDEIYLGKNIKKAYIDGNKKSLATQIDVSVITLILGITAYLIPNSILISFGSLLIVGSILNIVLNGALLRALSWLIYNSSTVANKLSLIGVDKKKVPNLSMDEKPTYFDQFKKRDNKKTSLALTIASSILLLASIIGLTTFQIVRGNIYNSTSAEQNSEVVIRIDRRNVSSDDSRDIQRYEENIRNVFLTQFYEDEDTLMFNDVEMETYNYSYIVNNVTNKEYYFIVSLDDAYNSDSLIYTLQNDGSVVEMRIEEALDIQLRPVLGSPTITLNQVYNVNNDSNNYYVMLYCLIGVAVSSVYMLFRFNISKTLTSILLVGGSLTVTIGIFSLINGPFASIITLGGLLLTLLGYIILITYFNKEKEVLREKRKEIDNDLSLRREQYEYCLNSYYPSIINLTLISSFIVISLFFVNGINQYLLILILAGMIIQVISTRFLVLPIEFMFATFFNKIKVKINSSIEERRKKYPSKHNKKNDDGPEEAIFVGIND